MIALAIVSTLAVLAGAAEVTSRRRDRVRLAAGIAPVPRHQRPDLRPIPGR